MASYTVCDRCTRSVQGRIDMTTLKNVFSGDTWDLCHKCFRDYRNFITDKILEDNKTALKGEGK